MTRFAQGRHAYGECAKSGRRMKINDMVTDPWSGMLVDPNWKEPAPQEPKDFEDAVMLRRMTGDLDKANAGDAEDLTATDLLSGLPIATARAQGAR